MIDGSWCPSRFQLVRGTSKSIQCAPKLRPIRLTDYRPPDWLIESVDLDVSLDPTATRIHAKLKIKPNSASGPVPLVLDGDELKLVSLALDGEPPPAESFVAKPDNLTMRNRRTGRLRSRSTPPSIPQRILDSWASTGPARPIALNARRRVFGALPFFLTGRT